MWSEWCCDRSCNQKSPLTLLSTFNLSGKGWQAERSGLWPIEAVHTDGQHLVSPSHEWRPFLTVAPPAGQLYGGSARCPRRPSAQRKTKSECNVNHKVITHASTRISMSFGDAAPWMYLVSKSRGTHRGREKATHEWKKTGFFKWQNTFLYQIYIKTTRKKDLRTAAQLSGCVTFSLIALISLCGGRQISLHVICIRCQAEFNIL